MALAMTKQSRLLAWGVYYGLFLILLGYAFIQAERWTLATFEDRSQTKLWEVWREKVKEEQLNDENKIPLVKRKIPKSHEPPALILFRDHYLLCAVATWFFGSILFLMLSGMAYGVFFSKNKAAPFE